MKHLFSFFLTVMAALSLQAKVVMPDFFSSGMVLQQQADCKIWGTADKQATVKLTTSWDNKTYKATADNDGHFTFTISTPQAGGPYTITVSDREKVTLSDVYIGEVWLCSGQSNMDMTLKGYKSQPVEGAIDELLNGTDPQLHFFTAKLRTTLTPQDNLIGQWRAADATSLRSCSATAYFFAKALRKQLGVPVGLIITAYGGSACEAWMNPEWLKEFPQVKLPTTEAEVNATKQRCPTALYNAQLCPVIGYGIRGAIWYQGEDNVPRYSYYAPLLKRMVDGWRSEWGIGTFPFYFCQIAPFDYLRIGWNDNSAYLREQQMKAEEIIDNSGMAVLMDTGLEYGIHPRKKRQAGERLALLALSGTYQVDGLPQTAKYKSMEIKGDTCVLSFDHSKEWIYFEGGPYSSNFEVAGADKQFYPAKAWFERNKVLVHSPKVDQPVAVRYGFHNWVEGDLMHDGLPVSSFRTDDW